MHTKSSLLELVFNPTNYGFGKSNFLRFMRDFEYHPENPVPNKPVKGSVSDNVNLEVNEVLGLPAHKVKEIFVTASPEFIVPENLESSDLKRPESNSVPNKVCASKSLQEMVEVTDLNILEIIGEDAETFNSLNDYLAHVQAIIGGRPFVQVFLPALERKIREEYNPHFCIRKYVYRSQK